LFSTTEGRVGPQADQASGGLEALEVTSAEDFFPLFFSFFLDERKRISLGRKTKKETKTKRRETISKPESNTESRNRWARNPRQSRAVVGRHPDCHGPSSVVVVEAHRRPPPRRRSPSSITGGSKSQSAPGKVRNVTAPASWSGALVLRRRQRPSSVAGRWQRQGKFETSPAPRRGRAPSSSVVVDVRRQPPPRSGVCLREQVGLHERHGGIVGRPLVVAGRRPSPADRNRCQRQGKFETSPAPRRGRAPSSSVVVDVRRQPPPRSGVCLRVTAGGPSEYWGVSGAGRSASSS